MYEMNMDVQIYTFMRYLLSLLERTSYGNFDCDHVCWI